MESESASAELQRKLRISATVADALVAGGLATIEEVAYVPVAEFLSVSGLPESEAETLRRVAKAYLLNESLGNDFFP
jgi:N utilization substance protein A